MRLTDDTKFPHPVLGPFTGDYLEGDFVVEFEVSENVKTGALSLNHHIQLTQSDIVQLVHTGRATVGCIVRCGHTYYNDLRVLSFPVGNTDFAPGALLNKVTLRPIIWLTQDRPQWSPDMLHPEFEPPVSLRLGDIVAIGAESQISVGQAKLVPIESIFELNKSSEVDEGDIRVDLEGDRISILVAPGTFSVIDLLRQQASGLPVVMNAVYLPAVMEVLDRLRGDEDAYQGRRWYTPFTEKCRAKGLVNDADASILDGAQRLLESPALTLGDLIKEE